MILLHHPQGSKAWKRARAGVITGSIIKKVRQSSSDVLKDMAFRLAVERISGEPIDEGHLGWAAERGHKLEPEARLAHQADIGVYVRPVGFALVDADRWFGCSADGLIDPKGGAEYKCFTEPTKLRRIVIDGDFSDVRDQALFCMWVCHREWWDMGLYCPALACSGQDFIRHRVQRDDDEITSMTTALLPFKRMVEDQEGIIRRRGRELGFDPAPIEIDLTEAEHA